MRTILRCLAACFLAAAVSGCPKNEIETVPPPDAGPYRERLDQLAVQYEILLKDNPSTNETYQFRQWLAQIEKDLQEGKTRDVETTLGQAEQWMTGARARFYNEHEQRVMAGKSAETAADLMRSATSFITIAEDKKGQGNAWAAQQYFQAAIEQSELALIAAQRSPEQVRDLIALADQMDAVYRAAGQPERAAETRERVIGALARIIADLDKSIRDCLRQRSPECSTEKLLEKEQNYKDRVIEMQKKSDLRNQVAVAAMAYAPDRFHPFDHLPPIMNFKNRWQAHWRPESVPPTDLAAEPEVIDLDQEKQMKSELAAHDQLRQGAVPAIGEGINLLETGVFESGDKVVVKGTLTNMKTAPIFNPRVTVVGGQLMSEVLDLGYAKMDPMISTSFQLPLKHFSPDALRLGGGGLPSHQLLLIFQDAQGREIKAVQPVR